MERPVTGRRYASSIGNVSSSGLPITAQVLDALHWDLALRHGWRAGRNPDAPDRVEMIVRELGAASASGDGADSIRLAARLATAIATRPPYAAGNLALALVSTCVILGRAGLDLHAEQGEVIAMLSALAEREIDRAGLVRWLRLRSVEREHALSSK